VCSKKRAERSRRTIATEPYIDIASPASTGKPVEKYIAAPGVSGEAKLYFSKSRIVSPIQAFAPRRKTNAGACALSSANPYFVNEMHCQVPGKKNFVS
jgi:hypothetical protein